MQGLGVAVEVCMMFLPITTFALEFSVPSCLRSRARRRDLIPFSAASLTANHVDTGSFAVSLSAFCTKHVCNGKGLKLGS